MAYNSEKWRYVKGPILGITEFRHRVNDLQVLVLPVASMSSALVMQTVHVGSGDEPSGFWGLAHFLEHLYFKGSRNFNPRNGNDYFRTQYFVGGVPNAHTNVWQTSYHAEVPADHVELVIAGLTDRLKNPIFLESDRRPEAGVVLQEMEMYESMPEVLLHYGMNEMAFQQHPYGRTVIGSATVVANSTVDKVKSFCGMFYHPNNITLLVAGNVSIEEVLRYADKHYGDIPAFSGTIPRNELSEVHQQGQRTFELIVPADLARVALSFRSPNPADKDWAWLDLIAEILGGSKARTSRLYRSLMQTGLVIDCGASLADTQDGFVLDATLREGVSASLVRDILEKELARLHDDLVSDSELKRAQTILRLNTRFVTANPITMMRTLNSMTCFADWARYATLADDYANATADDVRNAARRWLCRAESTLGILIPRTAEHAHQFPPPPPEVMDEITNHVQGEEVISEAEETEEALRAQDPDILRKTVDLFIPRSTKETAPIAGLVTQIVLTNGLKVNLLRRRAASGVLWVNTRVQSGNVFEDWYGQQNLADIVGDVLTRGSRNFSKTELALELSELGNPDGLQVNVGPFATSIDSQIAAEHLDRYLHLISDTLREPLFPQDELAQVTEEWRTRYVQLVDDPESVASAMLSRAIYPEGHVFNQKPFAEQASDLTSMDVMSASNFHRHNYIPKGTIITIVGDFTDEDQIVGSIERHFGHWVGDEPRSIVLPAGINANAGQTFTQQMIGKPSINVCMGAAIDLSRKSPDFLPVKLGLKILGANPLIGRLGERVREELGYTYAIYVDPRDRSYGWAPWVVRMIVAKKNLQAAIDEVHSLLSAFVTRGVTAAELDMQAENEAGVFNVRVDRMPLLAGIISDHVALGLSLSEIDELPGKARKLTVDDVNAAIKRHINPDQTVTAIAGSL